MRFNFFALSPIEIANLLDFFFYSHRVHIWLPWTDYIHLYFPSKWDSGFSNNLPQRVKDEIFLLLISNKLSFFFHHEPYNSVCDIEKEKTKQKKIRWFKRVPTSVENEEKIDIRSWAGAGAAAATTIFFGCCFAFENLTIISF